MSSIPSIVDAPRTSSQPRTWIPSLGRLRRNVSAVAIPVIALVVLANLPVAEANPYTDCIDRCDDAPEGVCRMICYLGCAILRG